MALQREREMLDALREREKQREKAREEERRALAERQMREARRILEHKNASAKDESFYDCQS